MIYLLFCKFYVIIYVIQIFKMCVYLLIKTFIYRPDIESALHLKDRGKGICVFFINIFEGIRDNSNQG